MLYGRNHEDVEQWVDEDGTVHNGGLLASRVRSGAWLDAQDFPPLRWTIEGVIPEGFGLIVAPPKAGKSWFVLGTALAKAEGVRALGCIQTRRGPVLYLALEDGHRRLQSRCRTLLGEGQPIPRLIDFIIDAEPHEVPILVGDWLEQHRDEQPLVILDTLGKVLPPKAAGESDYQRDYRVAGKLKALSDAVPGSTVLAVHHTRKAQGEDFVDAVSGTQGIAGAADFILVLARRRQTTEASLSVTGRDVIESEYAITSHDGAWALDGDNLPAAAAALTERKQTENLGDLATEVVRFVNGRDKTTPADLAAHLGIDTKTAGTRLSQAHKSGRINKTGRGVYTPFETVESFERGEPLDFTDPPVSTDSTVSKPLPSDHGCIVCGQPLLTDTSLAAGICARRDTAHNTHREGHAA
ncbi:AAA family ATPase [Rhodococcus aetherivorans]|uniref:AAA family ATPase n=1 Tax=Rhodococcus aetherivorans TaxID=191292 RepID=UPI00045CE7ED|nr:AAA family ATPase [Rhodococcus aetherivorans]KDE14924.1 hypothetical protein N505_0102105 [Rhodococcus aetherivorans]